MTALTADAATVAALMAVMAAVAATVTAVMGAVMVVAALMVALMAVMSVAAVGALQYGSQPCPRFRNVGGQRVGTFRMARGSSGASLASRSTGHGARPRCLGLGRKPPGTVAAPMLGHRGPRDLGFSHHERLALRLTVCAAGE